MYQPPYDNNPYINYYEQTPYNYIYQIQPRLQQVNYYRLLENTQKTLRTLNQIIPLINNVAPLLHNAAIMFRVTKAVKNISDNEISTNIIEPLYSENNIEDTTSNPTFFS